MGLCDPLVILKIELTLRRCRAEGLPIVSDQPKVVGGLRCGTCVHLITGAELTERHYGGITEKLHTMG